MKDSFSGYDAPAKRPVKRSSKGHRGGYRSHSLHGGNCSFKGDQSISERSNKVHPERAAMEHLDRAAFVEIARVAIVNLARVAMDNPARAAMAKLAR